MTRRGIGREDASPAGEQGRGPARSNLVSFAQPGCSAIAIPTAADGSNSRASCAKADMGLLIFYLFFAIGCSFYCSVAEAVLLSITPSFIATLGQRKPKAAKRLEDLKDNIDRPLAAILSLNTIAHTIGAAGVGAEVVRLYGDQYLAAASAVMTLLILVLSEIIPKTIGALYWRTLGPIVATSVRWLIWILYPLVWMSERLTRLLSGGKSHHTLTREELSAMAKIGAKQGVLEANEHRIFDSMIRFPRVTAQEVMTPRAVVLAVSESSTVAEALAQESILSVSRIPVYEGTLDHVSGFVLKDDLLLAQARGQDTDPITTYRRPLLTVRDEVRLPRLLDQLLQGRHHIAIVVDQYGSVVGLVTLEDIVETLLDLEIIDEHDREVDMQKLARRRWEKRLSQKESQGTAVVQPNIAETDEDAAGHENTPDA
ncbi:Hemolysin C [Crateriforma conspicua]|uniref:Hemolysin C n=2 Tax=Planctomycetaceae TaxID=126 RepID=A0A5C6FV27_9PLAN|nr:Hemolysin C [Crateriforma conspicua]